MVPDRPLFRLVAKGLSRAVGRTAILKGVSLSISSGEVVAIVGPNGSGKTTLLSILGGRLRPDVGEVILEMDGGELRGRHLSHVIALLPHDLFIYEDLTGLENLRLFAILHNTDPSEVDRALAEVGLERHGDQLARTYSRGMLQRLAAARLLVSGARVWLLDEPFSGLDESGRLWLRKTLSRHAEGGGIVVFSSHDREEVSTLASRIVAMKAGRVILDCVKSPETLHEAFKVVHL